MIAFKGDTNPNYLISGIPAYAQNHGLEKKTSLFTKTGGFPLALIKESDYNANKNSLGSVTPFAKIFALYNNTATNNNRFQISAKVGGEARLLVSKPTPWDVEIRKGGITGDTLGYVAPYMTSGNVMYLQPEVYDIYPVRGFYVCPVRDGHPAQADCHDRIWRKRNTPKWRYPPWQHRDTLAHRY